MTHYRSNRHAFLKRSLVGAGKRVVLPVLMLMGAVVSTVASADDPPTAVLVETRRIWDQAPHNAFTDLVRFKDR